MVCFGALSCDNDELIDNEMSKDPCIDSEIPCPIIIGDEKEGCVVNIIFLAEGFTESEMTEFAALCNVAKQAILDMEPFTSASGSLNFYRVESPSITSGIKTKQHTGSCTGTTGTTTVSQTPWSVFGNRVGLERYTGMEPEQRNKLEELYGGYATGDYAYTIIIANSLGFYGGAEFPGVTEYNTIDEPKVSNMIISKNDGDIRFKYLVRHEFGHSFGNLDDEYVDEVTNCALKEESWFIPETPKSNVLQYNPGSWFEGARYLPTGYWREWENSIMRSNFSSTTFSPIQKEIIDQRLADALGCSD